MSEITLLVEFAVKDGATDAYRAASANLRSFVDGSEPGTVRYDWWLSDDGRRGFNIEVFRDSDALAHHMRNTADKTGDLLAAADVVRVEVLGDLTDAGREAIAGAATGWFALLGGVDR